MERLQKVIANAGYASRRKAEELITLGKVKVNGVVIKELGTKVKDSDKVEVCGELINKELKVYYLLNKPRGVITSVSDDRERKTVVDIIKSPYRIYPIGRLDYDTTGILILTNDGDFANLLMHPKNEIEKVYIAKVKGILSLETSKKLKQGIIIDDYKTSPAKVKVRKTDKKENTCIVEITIHEGKNHQVKKMFESVGYEVLKLKRERIGMITLGKLQSGEFRKLNSKEVQQLYNMAQKKD